MSVYCNPGDVWVGHLLPPPQGCCLLGGAMGDSGPPSGTWPPPSSTSGQKSTVRKSFPFFPIFYKSIYLDEQALGGVLFYSVAYNP